MNGWETILIWRFKGPRFDDNGIELRDLAALASLRAAIVEGAKQLWHQENPEAKQLPAHFEDQVILKVFDIEKGSACLAIKAPIEPEESEEEPERQTNFESVPAPPPKKPAKQRNRLPVKRAAARVADFAIHVVGGSAPTTRYSNDELRHLKDTFAESAHPEDKVEVEVPPEPPPKPRNLQKTRPHVEQQVAQRNGTTDVVHDVAAVAMPRKVLITQKERANVGVTIEQAKRVVVSNDNSIIDDESINIFGEVIAADVKKNEARITIDSRQIVVPFTTEHEERVTQALHDHNKARLRIHGRGIRDKRGTLVRITAVKTLDIEPIVVEPVQTGFNFDEPVAQPSEKRHNQTVPTWDTPCEAMFEYLAQHDPAKLLAMLEDGSLRPGHLTHAAEAAGTIEDSTIVVPILLRLLEHKSPLVREGALYGLARHPNDDVIARIRAIAESDPIEEVQDAARSVLEDE